MSDGNGELPANWTTATIAELCQINPKHVPKLDDALEVSFVPMAAVSDTLGKITKPEIRRLGAVRKGYTHFADGDVIFAKITPCMENGKAASVRGLVNGLACGTTEFFVLRPNGAVDQDYLFYFVRQESYRKAARRTMQSGVGQARVPKEFIEGTELPIPPLAEQRRMVATIEALQERSRKARAALAEVGPLLEQFRQSLLAAAFRGDLTADWRAAHPDVEPASELLTRIRKERREKWEQSELAKYEAKGKTPPKGWQEKYQEPEPVDDSELPELPEGWCWARLPELGCMNRGKSRHRPRNAAHLYGGPYPFVQTGDIAQSGGRITSHKQSYSDAGLAQSKMWPGGTVCITIAANIASSAILTYPACFPDSIVGVIPDEAICSPEFVELFIRTAKENLERFAPSTAQKNINIETLSDLAVPLPPAAEVVELVQFVQKSLAAIEQVGDVNKQSQIEIAELDQSILAKAFRGELVPQDPADEPAAVLLERIRQQREAQAAAQNGQPKRRTRRKEA